MISEGEIPGKIIDGRPWVDLPRFLAGRESVRPVDDDVYELLYS